MAAFVAGAALISGLRVSLAILSRIPPATIDILGGLVAIGLVWVLLMPLQGRAPIRN